jgi:sulfoxide reductase heme-binding subunit YedZ
MLPTWVVYCVGILPAINLFVAAFTDRLGPDPLKVLENGLGEWALQFLIMGLTITPLMRFARINLVRYRRAIGLVAFAYVVLHLSVYLLLDRQLDVPAIIKDIIKRPYITIGMTAFLLLLPLACTSNNWSVRRLGAKNWQRLHKLVYVAAILGAVHYLLLVKAWPMEPIVYLGITVAVIALRWFYPMRKARPAT